MGLLTLEGGRWAWTLLEPYGAGNPKPVFSPVAAARWPPCADVGGGRHLKLKLHRGRPHL